MTMATKSQKIRVGLFAAVTGTLLAVVVVVFGSLQFWEARSHYKILFEGSVFGLEDGAHVYLNGVRAGLIEDIRIAPGDLGKVEVTISVEEDTPIRRDTRAMLIYAGVTGLKVVDLREGSLASPRLPEGGTILEGLTTLDRLETQAQMLADQSTLLLMRANQIIDNLIIITDARQFEGMADVVAQAKVAADNLAATSGSLRTMVGENGALLRQSLEAFHAAAQRARTVLDEQVAGLLGNAGDVVGELEALVGNNRRAVRGVVSDLREASRSLKELAREVRRRPSQLLFSTPPPERELP
jgi:phospholipid/cholesterol/gamma-HCH transport system substrate-binding protein